MKKKDNKILQISKATIERVIPNEDIENSKVNAHALVPVIKIDNIDIRTEDILSISLKSADTVPMIELEFIDAFGNIKGKNLIRDGSTLTFAMKGYGNFKPLNMDFFITHIDDSIDEPDMDTSVSIYEVRGILKLPFSIRRTSGVYPGTSYKVLMEQSRLQKIGFASNVEDTADEMIWLNMNSTFQDFCNDVVAHSYANDESFFTAFVDFFYIMNFVEVDSLFTQTDTYESLPDDVYIYKSSVGMDNDKDLRDTKTNPEDNKEPDKSNATPDFKKGKYYITNNPNEKIWNNYFSKYKIITKPGKSISDGYKKYVQYWDYNNKEFVSEYVDPINHLTDGMIAVNKGRIIGGKSENNNLDEFYTWTNFGIQDSDNVHANFYWAETQNSFNISECEKFQIEVVLDAYNPAITRMSRVWVELYNISEVLSDEARTADDEGTTPELNTDTDQRINTDTTEEVYMNTIRNDGLSGFWVVSRIELIYENYHFSEKVILSRREMKPLTQYYKKDK